MKIMTLKEFTQTLSNDSPPQNISKVLEALWHDGKGDWITAHEIAQTQEGVQSYDQLHAYLHRKEGDNWNANYWYKRAKITMPDTNLVQEWTGLVQEQLVT